MIVISVCLCLTTKFWAWIFFQAYHKSCCDQNQSVKITSCGFCHCSLQRSWTNKPPVKPHCVFLHFSLVCWSADFVVFGHMLALTPYILPWECFWSPVLTLGRKMKKECHTIPLFNTLLGFPFWKLYFRFRCVNALFSCNEGERHGCYKEDVF